MPQLDCFREFNYTALKIKKYLAKKIFEMFLTTNFDFLCTASFEYYSPTFEPLFPGAGRVVGNVEGFRVLSLITAVPAFFIVIVTGFVIVGLAASAETFPEGVLPLSEIAG